MGGSLKVTPTPGSAGLLCFLICHHASTAGSSPCHVDKLLCQAFPITMEMEKRPCEDGNNKKMTIRNPQRETISQSP